MCKYCEDKEDITNHIISGYVAEERDDNISVSAFIYKDEMVVSANYLTLKASINFCPMCGCNLHKNQIRLDFLEQLNLTNKLKKQGDISCK